MKFLVILLIAGCVIAQERSPIYSRRPNYASPYTNVQDPEEDDAEFEEEATINFASAGTVPYNPTLVNKPPKNFEENPSLVTDDAPSSGYGYTGGTGSYYGPAGPGLYRPVPGDYAPSYSNFVEQSTPCDWWGCSWVRPVTGVFENLVKGTGLGVGLSATLNFLG